MQRILSIYDWQLLKPETAFVVKSDLEHQRTVRLRVNAPETTAIYLQQVDKTDGTVLDVFLARVEGQDEIQFDVFGDYKIFTSGTELWFDTLDGTRPDVEPVDATSFTNIVERQARNPELEIMELRMRQNAEAREALLLAAFKEEMALMRGSIEADRANTAGASGSVQSQTPPASSGDGQSGGEAGTSSGDAGGGESNA